MIKGFLGANSMNGFYNNFNNCTDYNRDGRLFILKGGSGSGKSTTMRKIIEFLRSLSYECDEFYCSSDVDSLDGIYCEKLNIGIIDGTAPHVVDPSLYGVYDEIINMGDCMSSFKLGEAKKEIAQISVEKKQRYDSAYSYLFAGGKLFLDVCQKYDKCLLPDMLGLSAYEFFDSLKLERSDMVYPFYRKIFVNAFTPTGFKDFMPQYLTCKNAHVLSGGFDNIYSAFLCMLANYSKMFLRRIDYLCHPLCPDMILGLYLQDIDTIILTQGFLGENKYDGITKIDISNCFKKQLDQKSIQKQENQSKILLDFASEEMSEAKKLHEKLENLYRPSIDFEKVNGKISEIITKIQTI